MRLWLAISFGLLLGAQPAFAGSLATMKGPAANTIRTYLQSQQTECSSDPDKKCSLASQVADARLAYGNFPGDPRSIAVLFLYEYTGGSGVDMDVYVWAAKPPASFALLGSTGATGGEPKNVRFERGGSIKYVGTVMRDGDAHCCPTGKKQFQVKVSTGRVSFVGPR